MTTTLVLPSDIADQISDATQQSVEVAGVLLVRPVEVENGLRLLGYKINWVPESSYLVQAHDDLVVASSGFVPSLGEAERDGASAIWVHTHPGEVGIPMPSPKDRKVDSEICELFRIRSGSKYYGALIASPAESGMRFSGHIEEMSNMPKAIDRLWIVGDRFRLLQSVDRVQGPMSEKFDRNIRAFGPTIQKTLSELRIGVVGCGGTGSAVSEQLARLGARYFLLVDPDHLSESNLTRVYGSGQCDVGRAKVEVIADNLRRINSDVVVNTLKGMITKESNARRLSQCDIIFGCTDDNAGRLVLSRLSTYFLTPVIDCGVLLSSGDDGVLHGIHGRVTTLVPGQACLVCRGRIDLRRAATELLTPDERVRLEHEGYAPVLGRTEPAVVTFTSLVGSSAVSELLERLIGYGPEPRPSEVLLRCHDREISTNVQAPRQGHYCDPLANKLALGETQPFLEQAWA